MNEAKDAMTDMTEHMTEHEQSLMDSSFKTGKQHILERREQIEFLKFIHPDWSEAQRKEYLDVGGE